jgi:hypothetical protein
LADTPLPQWCTTVAGPERLRAKDLRTPPRNACLDPVQPIRPPPDPAISRELGAPPSYRPPNPAQNPQSSRNKRGGRKRRTRSAQCHRQGREMNQRGLRVDGGGCG